MGHPDPFRKVHVFALVLCVVFLPWSTAFLSMAQMLLLGNWLVEGFVRGTWGERWRSGLSSAPVLVFLSFFGLHLLGLAWTEDLKWGTDLVRILLPVLVLGLVLGSTQRLSHGELKYILLWGAWSVVASTIVCTFMAAGDADHRELSRFISHIRLALLLSFAIVTFGHYLRDTSPLYRGIHLAAGIWCLFFIVQLGSLQALLMLGLIGILVLWRSLRLVPSTGRAVLRSLLLILPLATMWWITSRWDQLRALPDPTLDERTEYTPGGERYTHDLTRGQRENDQFVWTYLAWGEVERVWKARGGRDLELNDDKGHPMYGTVARYLTSMGLRKDSMAVMTLTDADMQAIERGVPNALKGQHGPLRERVEEVLFELEQYTTYGRADGHSVTMRLEFWKTGWTIVRDHWLTGVGTGDTQLAFNAAYDRMDSTLSQQWRLRAHQQYLTLWISFGVFGLLWSLFSWWWPAWKLGAWRDPLFIAWAVIFGIAGLVEDTIETQAGATFFALYYTLLVFAPSRNSPLREAVPAGPPHALHRSP